MKPFDIQKIPRVEKTATVVFRDGSTGPAWRAPNGSLYAEQEGYERFHFCGGQYSLSVDTFRDIVGIYEPPIVLWAVVDENGKFISAHATKESAMVSGGERPGFCVVKLAKTPDEE